VTFTLPFSGGRVTGNDEAGAVVARAMAETDRDYKRQTDAWVAWLRSLGVKAAHPDDGWVDRRKSEVHLCYPYFDAGPAMSHVRCGCGLVIGDLVRRSPRDVRRVRHDVVTSPGLPAIVTDVPDCRGPTRELTTRPGHDEYVEEVVMIPRYSR